MRKPLAHLKVGDRLCFFREVAPKNEEKTVIWVVTNIQVETKFCAFKGSGKEYCPCASVCNAFDGKVFLEQEGSSEKQPIFNIREFLKLIREKRIWHVDSQELFEHSGIYVQPGGAR